MVKPYVQCCLLTSVDMFCPQHTNTHIYTHITCTNILTHKDIKYTMKSFCRQNRYKFSKGHKHSFLYHPVFVGTILCGRIKKLMLRNSSASFLSDIIGFSGLPQSMKTCVYVGLSLLGITSNTNNGEIMSYGISIRQNITQQ